jgi:hypothetical protein
MTANRAASVKPMTSSATAVVSTTCASIGVRRMCRKPAVAVVHQPSPDLGSGSLAATRMSTRATAATTNVAVLSTATAQPPIAANRAVPTSGATSRSPSCRDRSAPLASPSRSPGSISTSSAPWAALMMLPPTPYATMTT